MRFRMILVMSLAGWLLGCDSSTGTGGSSGSGGGGKVSSRFGVTDSVLGRWVGIAGTSSASDTFLITKDSLSGIWSVGENGTVRQSLFPYSDAKFYAHHGRMGTTNGMTVEDNVSFEYVFSGDTLFLELMGSLQPNGSVDRGNEWFTHALLKR